MKFMPRSRRATPSPMPSRRPGAFFLVIIQIIIIDMVFSLDSIITAIGMAQDIEIMVAAVVIACFIMYVSSGPVARFVADHPTTKMLALAFLVLIGVALVADGFKFHIPRGYIYFAITFSAAVELFNVLAKRNRKKPSISRSSRRVDNAASMAFASISGRACSENTKGEIVMTKAVRVHKVGGPEALVYENVEVSQRRDRARFASASTPSASTSSTSITAPASTRRRACRSSPAMKPPAKWWRSVPASPIFIPAIASPIISISAAMPPSA